MLALKFDYLYRAARVKYDEMRLHIFSAERSSYVPQNSDRRNLNHPVACILIPDFFEFKQLKKEKKKSKKKIIWLKI